LQDVVSILLLESNKQGVQVYGFMINPNPGAPYPLRVFSNVKEKGKDLIALFHAAADLAGESVERGDVTEEHVDG
jgi:hypothetical protein